MMIKSIQFPSVAGGLPRPNMFRRYYDTYYRYILNTITAAGIKVKFIADTAVGDARFLINADGHQIIMDYSDHIETIPNPNKYPYFKFHRSTGVHNSEILAFTPVSFYDWNEYNNLSNSIRYVGASDKILNIQRPYGNATTRRNAVRSILIKKYGRLCDIRFRNPIEYWKCINDCLVHVFVPGYRPDMLDRGQIQYIALGCCTVSPRIITELPYNKQLIPGEHYIECMADYSDLIDKIEWCKGHRQECKTIGINAKNIFIETSTPQKLWQWVYMHL